MRSRPASDTDQPDGGEPRTDIDKITALLKQGDGGRGVPLYRQISDGLAVGIGTGVLGPGDRLPTHRALAAQLGVAVPTVTRAYREAEQRGLIASTVGRGTFVTGGIPTLREHAVTGAAPTATHGARRVDLSVNAPARGEHQLLLSRTLHAIADTADPTMLAGLLSYSADIGGLADRRAASTWLALSGAHIDPDQLVITHGGQHAILIALAATTQPGDVVLTEELTYPGVKSAAALLNLKVVGLAMDEHGVIPDALNTACVGPFKPAAIYLTPNLHNPTTLTTPLVRRQELLQAAARHNLTLIEDNAFGHLVPDADRVEPFVALAPERTVHLASLSKSVTPGLRWGAVAGPAHLSDRLGALVRASIFNPAPLAVSVARQWLNDGTAERLASWQRTEMGERFVLAQQLLGSSRAVASIRTGGLHAWVELAEPWTPTEAVAAASRVGVEISPTAYFHADVDQTTRNGSRFHLDGLRLCLGNPVSREVLEAGLSQLVDAWSPGPTFSTGTRI